ncbi:acyl-CoA dehydrogenase family protein [Mumia sp. ZJ1417]|uniref:acyl-CoA dehydrogenase family protein n=1 Tax=Mumia sp. ZJ1417 TaxID=2708082 RepID=UPI001C70CD19
MPDLSTGRRLACFGLTEPDSGSDPASLRTRAIRRGTDYVINGSKIFITNGTWADVCLVFARTGEDGPRRQARPPWPGHGRHHIC